MNKLNLILERAKRLAKETKTWADFSNALFDPFDGEVVRALPTQLEREAFRKTKEYKELRALLRQKMNETGMTNGATPKKSGKFVVRLPRSLHAALEREAEDEGTSLNQLVVTKLAVQLDSVAGGRFLRQLHGFENRGNNRKVVGVGRSRKNRRFQHPRRHLRQHPRLVIQ